MALNINTNIGALGAAAAATSVNKSMETSMSRLSTGLRVNTAADDAAGVAIGSRLTSEIRGTNQAIRNAMDAQALIDTAEGAHNEIVNILQRMRELAVQAANDTNDSDDRTALQAEMTALTSEINRIADVSSWAGKTLIDGSYASTALNFHIGTQTNAADVISVNIDDMGATALGIGGEDVAAADMTVDQTGFASGTATLTASAGKLTFASVDADDFKAGETLTITWGSDYGGGTTTFTVARDGAGDEALLANATALADKINSEGIGLTATASTTTLGEITIKKGSLSVASNSAAQTTIDAIDAAILTVNTQRANLGAVSNRLDSTVSNLTNISTNLEAGRSRILDADFAAESTNLAKSQILQQASMAMLAQANASKQGVLQLLQG